MKVDMVHLLSILNIVMLSLDSSRTTGFEVVLNNVSVLVCIYLKERDEFWNKGVKSVMSKGDLGKISVVVKGEVVYIRRTTK